MPSGLSQSGPQLAVSALLDSNVSQTVEESDTLHASNAAQRSSSPLSDLSVVTPPEPGSLNDTASTGLMTGPSTHPSIGSLAGLSTQPSIQPSTQPSTQSITQPSHQAMAASRTLRNSTLNDHRGHYKETRNYKRH